MIELLVQHEEKIYDVSGITTKAETSYTLNDGCGKLVFDYIPDSVDIACGDVVRLRENGENIFYGKVFTISGGKNKTSTVTVYDQLRYCKTKDAIVVQSETLRGLVVRMCGVLSLNKGDINTTPYVLATSLQDNKTWLDIIYTAISDTLVGCGQKFRLADEFGSITLRNMELLTTNLVLGDGSLCYDYTHGSTVDDGAYNQIKIVSSNTASGKIDVTVRDSASIAKYGLLQYFEVANEEMNGSQAKTKAEALLKLYDHEVKTLKLNCIGYNRFREGVSFYGSLEDIKINQRLIVKSVKHSYLPNHTMELEVYL